jgi:hypothetical protein
MWGTDMSTTLTTEEREVYVFVSVDHCNSKCIGFHPSLSSNRFEALEPWAVRARALRRLRKGDRQGPVDLSLSRRACMSDDFQQELALLGMTSALSFVLEPEGNDIVERFIPTLPANLLWVRSFATVGDLVASLREFRLLYNEQWLIERHDYRSASQVRRERGATTRAVA